MTAGADSVRGLSGKTITVGGMFDPAQFAGAQVGAEAYFDRLNKTNYLHGLKIKFVGFVNDQLDPAVALSAARQLVTQDSVFAIVPDISPVNPVSYLASNHVPYVGYGIDATYCSRGVTTNFVGILVCRLPGPFEPIQNW